MHHILAPYRWFLRINYAVLTLLALLCLFPLVNILAISFSSSAAVAAGKVTFWPVDWTLSSYTYMMDNRQFTGSFLVSLTRVTLGVAVNLVLTILVAYPLSKDARTFRSRTVYAWIFVFTMLFSGGLIPTYLVVKETGMLNSVWALILPGVVPIFNVLLMLNFFRGLPKELEEAALSVKEVAAETGYPDDKYFMRLFRHHTNMTPTQYRNAYHKTFMNNV
ncbi:AraC family transcriptional regulator [Paenibacillus sp. S-38]|uniref:carbohydrate ABC transporter permease n=1 Tax=Paenibacillus sp. S-38 TaxID=3416710 RepID=UPI003CEC080E